MIGGIRHTTGSTSITAGAPSDEVLPEVLRLQDVAHRVADHFCGDHNGLPRPVGGVEADLLHHLGGWKGGKP